MPKNRDWKSGLEIGTKLLDDPIRSRRLLDVAVCGFGLDSVERGGWPIAPQISAVKLRS